MLFAAGVGAIALAVKARTVRTREGRWRALGAGAHGMLQDADATLGTQTSVVRMDAGATLAEHEHGGPEESFLLEGECTTEGRDVPTHGYLRAPGGSHHGATHMRSGCRMIVVAARRASGHPH